MSPKTLSPLIAILLILGGAVFPDLLGGLHAIYTLLDLRNPRRLVPVDALDFFDDLLGLIHDHDPSSSPSPHG
jgi:hypothetical protein